MQEIDGESEISSERFDALASHSTARAIRATFAPDGKTKVHKLSSLMKQFESLELSQSELTRWLDLLSGTRREANGQSYLPLRIHLFHNVLNGLFACVDRNCPAKPEILSGEDWAFGSVYTSERLTCACSAPVLPLVSCKECNALHLQGMVTANHRLTAPQRDSGDEFALDADEDSEETREDNSDASSPLSRSSVLVSNRLFEGRCPPSLLDTADHTLRINPGETQTILLHLREQDDPEYCPACDSQGGKVSIMRRLAFGSPLTMGLVTGTLLEFCPDDKDAPLSKPFRGRKMISFTDSRQGTARLALKLQQDSERNRVRGLIYHLLLQSAGASEGLSSNEQMLLTVLLQMKAAGTITVDQASALDRLTAKQHSTPMAELGWNELRAKLAGSNDIEAGMLDYYAGIAPSVFQAGAGASMLALMLMYREFARRPKNRNSLESMGLVALHYPQLETLSKAPAGWPHGLEAWRSYLKVLLDFYVRENSFVELDINLQRFVGIRISPKWLLAPTSKEVADNRHTHWVQVRPNSSRQPRPIKLLLKSTGWEVDRKQDQIDALLRAAWVDLTERAVILIKSEDGYRLDFTKVALRTIVRAGICPISRRFIDTPFMGMTPYASAKAPDAVCKVEMTDIPVYPDAFGKGDDFESKLTEARNWLESEPQVHALREQGLWSDLHDRTIEGGAWLRCVEHSAQQPRSRLKRYEDLFKSGRINVMSCSTTMEMGVDIGGISVVAMNNVPPHPANYLQRAGRAGRRSEGRAVALTVCKNTPHDQGVFSRPDWPFAVTIPVPDVSLRSRDLVQRHINAWLLSHWFRNVARNEELKGVNCAAFFRRQGEYSVAERFMLWCEHGEKNLNAVLRAGLEALVTGTSLQSVQASRLAADAGTSMRQSSEQWTAVYEGVVQQLKIFEGETSKNSALKALEIQIRRIEDEYLLSELANRRFLPGYGFPTDVVSLDNRTRSAVVDGGATREDNRGRYQDLPSRDRVTALREYAPGADLVMDGLIYRSRGITLNWHVPASEADAREAQLFKYAWRCRRCGASGNSMSVRPECCQECGFTLEARDIPLYLVPSGFAVDFFDEPHTDVTVQRYMPVEQPWLSVNAPWIALANAGAGRFRTSNHAHLFSHSSGESGLGYAVCLECGRAEAMLEHEDPKASPNERSLPTIFRAKSLHRRLRGNKGQDNTRTCAGSDSSWKIKQYVHLGHDSIGDALEVMLSNVGGTSWLNDDVAAFSIAIAMRAAIAKILGILEDELGCATAPILQDGKTVRTIQVFDQRSGGYTTLVAPQLQTAEFWTKVRNALFCSVSCESACQHCLLTFDTRFAADRLNRHRALEVLDEAWITSLALPENLQVFGEMTLPESVTLWESLSMQCESGGVQRVRIYLHEDSAQWDLPSAHRLQRLLYGWYAQSLPIELYAAMGTLASMDEANQRKLSEWTGAGAQYFEAASNQLSVGTDCLPFLAAVRTSNGWTAWASNSNSAFVANSEWGELAAGDVLVRGQVELYDLGAPISSADISLHSSSDRDLELNGELDGTIDGFGNRFWKHVSVQVPAVATLLSQSNDRLIAVEYCDRYIRSPLAAALFISLVYALKGTAPGDAGFAVRMQTLKFLAQRESLGRLWDDWRNDAFRDVAVNRALDECGLESTVESAEPGAIEHSRVLTLRFASGRLISLRLDQGVSYWVIPRGGYFNRFDFGSSVSEQARNLITMAGNIAAPSGLPSHVFVKAN
ncbi:helicase C-terminal domain-containing protein [Rugamonas sp. DEMB1]|uniref:helicase C-terminal domain-containing protein n=1 Tax=Rugamonas sp. DEMB1 TaxID=3039386 RepID=UPI002449C49B|nr:helicase C-terminal domain-containing protein [Rugamonas sp. DEMB1]WGG51454.1 helicase C-terminal domain-containing protein [Rugamonas sp. DEMB1]